MFVRGLAILTITVAVMLVAGGCGGATKSKGGGDADKKSEHASHPPGPHKGTLEEFLEGHAEVVVDRGKKEITFYLLDADDDSLKPQPAAIKEVVVILNHIKPKPVNLDLKAVDEKDGKASTFVGSHEALADPAEWDIRVSGKVDGGNVSATFKEMKAKK